MNDPTPVRTLLLLQLLALLCLAGYWASLDAPARGTQLRRVQVEEHIPLPPPPTLLDQPGWLWNHRLARLQSMAGLLALALVIGACEGGARRRQDVLGGFRLTPFTVGVLALALAPGVTLAYLLLPWPLPFGAASAGLAGWGGGITFCLWRGRPHVL